MSSFEAPFEFEFSPTSPSYCGGGGYRGRDEDPRSTRLARFLTRWSQRMGTHILATALTDSHVMRGDREAKVRLLITDKAVQPPCDTCFYKPYCTGSQCRYYRSEDDIWRLVEGEGQFLEDVDAGQFYGCPPCDLPLVQFDHSQCCEDAELLWMCGECKWPLCVELDAVPHRALQRAGALDALEEQRAGRSGECRIGATGSELTPRLDLQLHSVTRACACAGGCGDELLSQRHRVELQLPRGHRQVMRIENQFLCPCTRAAQRRSDVAELRRELAGLDPVLGRLRGAGTYAGTSVPQEYEARAAQAARAILAEVQRRRERLALCAPPAPAAPAPASPASGAARSLVADSPDEPAAERAHKRAKTAAGPLRALLRQLDPGDDRRSLAETVRLATEAGVEAHSAQVWAMLHNNDDIPGLDGLLPPCATERHGCQQRLHFDADTDNACPRNSADDWGLMDEDGWTCHQCYARRDPDTGCSKLTCPRHNQLGQCALCRPSYAHA